MRLWHQSLISRLPRQQLLGQHRECCAMRGLGWGKKHSVVNYVFDHPYYWLYLYHDRVMREMNRRGFKIDSDWFWFNYRGKQLGFDESDFTRGDKTNLPFSLAQIYPEHDEKYLTECLENLKRKGVEIHV